MILTKQDEFITNEMEVLTMEPQIHTNFENGYEIVYNDVFDKSHILLNIYNDIDGSFYKIMYFCKKNKCIYFSDVKSRLISDVLKMFNCYCDCDIDGIHYEVKENNDIYIKTNKTKKINGYCYRRFTAHIFIKY